MVKDGRWASQWVRTVRSAAKHQSGTSSNHVRGSKASHAGPSPAGPLPGSHIGASQPSPASHSGLSP
ncbi:hypothetical protein SORBI_3004G096801 [Sorghum bicolor]|uniref:Uncharacterized protein n=1 Tax=Sorghum bicolor TaxID=4558 RepID=A0A1Z5RLN7_SORBI|nr:hypothetical protein SORBI_3004G096801 [Sorghum bicolor]